MMHKPNNMSRRGFLRLLGLTATTVMLGSSLVQVEEFTEPIFVVDPKKQAFLSGIGRYLMKIHSNTLTGCDALVTYNWNVKLSDFVPAELVLS